MCIEETGISVVMATFNGAIFIKEQLESIIYQSLQPNEIIIVDDNSTDETYKIILEYQSLYPHLFKVYKNNHTLGPSRNFKKALSLSSYPLIAVSDQDDIWDLNKLQVLKDLLLSSNKDLVFHQDIILYEDGHTERSNFSIPGKNTIIWGNRLCGHSMLFNRTLLNVFQDCGEMTYDYALAFKASLDGNYLSTCTPLCIWRRHSNAVTSAFRHNKQHSKALNQWTKFCYTAVHLRKNKSKAIEIAFKDRANFLFIHGEKKLANICLRVSRQTIPSFISASFHYQVYQQSYGLTLKKRIGLTRRAFFAPWVYWYDMHNELFLE